MTRHVILGTAGHIDHGKTTLVHALTGIDPTRSPEERERGMTIDIGFAYMDLPDGSRLGIVDVPGHERFVRNMLAGAAGIDFVLLVIDVNEGVMPQTREHLDIIHLLGVTTGCVALTKIDTADAEFVEIVASEVSDLLADTALAGAPVLPISSTTGTGLPALRDTLAQLALEVQERSNSGICRIPIDRVFTMKGHGTVVTGTITGGTLRVNDELIALPCGVTTRVRQLQSHGDGVEQVTAGMRVAMNCGGISTTDLARGETLVHPGTAEATGFFNARIRVLAQAAHPVRHRRKLKCYIGTGSAVATPILVDGDAYGPGTEGFAQLRLDRPLLALRGDRFILRTGSPEITIGGGEVIDPFPVKVRRRTHVQRHGWEQVASGNAAAAAVQWLAEAEQGMTDAALARRLGVPAQNVPAILSAAQSDGACMQVAGHPEQVWVHGDVLQAAIQATRDTVTKFFAANPTRMGMPREAVRTTVSVRYGAAVALAALTTLIETGEAQEVEGALRMAGRTVNLPPHLADVRDRLLRCYADAQAGPPLLTHVAGEMGAKPKDVETVVAMLQEDGTLLRVGDNLAYTREQWQRIAAAIQAHFDRQDTLAVADLKDLLRVTRKHAMPILEYADATGLTMRKGDVRVLRR